MTAAALRILISALLAPLPAAGWHDLGHRLVARLAELRLTPHTREAVRDVLGGQSLADAAVWADHIKLYRHDADRLHYVNIPLRDTVYLPEKDCQNGRCLIGAIESDRRILADPAASPSERAEALRFLVHFLGDLHQPLHVADNSDRGGNRRMVYLLGDPMSLHQAWDGELIARYGLSQSAYFELLRREMDSMDVSGLERGTVVDWAMEGHRIAVERVYGPIPRGGRLRQWYVAESRPVVDHALIAGGVRLAKVLNEALAGYRLSQGAGPIPRTSR
jgi:hypothetical protein